MTITATVSEIEYAGDGVSTVFSVPFVFDTSADLKVVRTDTDGNAVELSTGYSVAGGGGSTGTVTLSTALASGYTLTISDDPDLTQPVDYVANDDFPAESHEDALDRGVRISKRILQIVKRALRTTDGDPSGESEMLLPSVQTRKGKVLGFNATTGAPEMVASVTSVGSLSASIIGGFLYAQTAAESAAGVTPTLYQYPPGDVRRYGAAGDGVTNDAAALQRWISGASDGALLTTVPGQTYRCGSGLTIASACQIDARGANFTFPFNGTAITISASNVAIRGGKYTGNSAAYNASGIGIFATGTLNGAGVAPTYLENVNIYDAQFLNFGNEGIEYRYIRDSVIAGNSVKTCGYAGIFGYSCLRVVVRDNEVDTLVGENVSGQLNAYGISFTSLVNTSDFVQNPQSTDCTVQRNRVRNVPTWTAIDTHGGLRIRIVDNEIDDCRRGVILTNLTTRGASYCVVDSNTLRNSLTGTNTNGTRRQGEAFWDIGVSSAIRNQYNRFTNNRVFQHGNSHALEGCAYINFAEDGVFDGNVLHEPYNIGIQVAGTVRRYSIKRNDIIDAKGPGTGAGGPTDFPFGISFTGDTTTDIEIAHNSISRRNTAADTVVGQVGINVGNFATKSIRFFSNQFSGIVTEWSFGADVGGLTGDIELTFTGTLTGCTTTPTGTVKYTRNGKFVTLSIPQISATSNSTAATITGAPTSIAPATAKRCLVRVQDNGTASLGLAEIGTGGVITLYLGATAAVFTGSGTKSIEACSITYSLD